MTTFVQLHLLTAYGPSNLNRDDLGRPKTVTFGGATRLRVSSQSLKRAWRTSDVFSVELPGHLGTRTKRKGVAVQAALLDAGIDEGKATDWAQSIVKVFGAVSGKHVETEQLVHYTPEEEAAVEALVETLAKRKSPPTDDELQLLSHSHTAADVALFGRMLAAAPRFNVEAAGQVAHAFTVHRVAVEDDYFSAVDDLNAGVEDVGAAHIGVLEFGAGLFYSYVCINRDLLHSNLGGDSELGNRALRALLTAATTVAPRGKQATFASRSYASYVMAERGDDQPRQLSVAFLTPVYADDVLGTSIAALESARDNMDRAYGGSADVSLLNTTTGEGSLAALLDFVVG